MAFWEDIEQSVGDLFEIAGEPAVWNGTPITVLPALPAEAGLSPEPGIFTERKDLQVQAADLERIGRPVPGERITLDGQIWEVAAVSGERLITITLARYRS